jgi:nitrous oxidase accessory protein
MCSTRAARPNASAGALGSTRARPICVKASTRHVLIALGVTSIVALAAGATTPHPTGLEGPPPPHVEDAGTIVQPTPPGAIVAEDEAALTRLLAAGPREIWLRDRIYRGDLVISRTISLHGTGGSVLEGSGRGTVVEIEANDAVLDDVTIRHSGRSFTLEDAGVKAKAAGVRITHVAVEDSLFGIELAPCPSCTIEHSRVLGPRDDLELRGDAIKLWEAHDATVRGCVVDRGRDVVVWYSRRAVLDGNVVRHGRYGTHFMYSHDAVVKNSRLENNVVGIFVMYSARLRAEHDVLAGAHGPAGIGIGFKESDGVEVEDSWIVANTTGIYLDRSPREAAKPVSFARNVIALNDVALRFLSSEEGVSFSHNDFHRNVDLADIEGGGDALGTKFDHNHWSEYQGYDLDRDGVGDVRFEVKRLSGELTDEHPMIRFFEGTGALALYDAIARAVPTLSTRTLLVDEKPSMVAERPR